MREEINFQLFGISPIFQHKIDPHVITEITETIHKNRTNTKMSGLLLGRQEGVNFHIKNVIFANIFDIDPETKLLSVETENIVELIEYAKNVYGLGLVAWFAY